MFVLTDSPRKDFESSAGPRAGRLILLCAAYAPVVVIVGLRLVPSCVGWIIVSIGLVGVLVWVLFLAWLPNRQPRTVIVEAVDFIDTEVTGYIVSILLPVIAASGPSLGDWLAYGLCATLILVVAFVAELWSVNPVTYAFGMRAARATLDGSRKVVLVRRDLGEGREKIVASRLGVTLVLADADRRGT